MRWKKRAQGFTLVELLVALALTGMVALLLLEGIRVASLGLDRVADVADRLEARRNLEETLRREFSAIYAAPSAPNLGGLVGTPASVDFLTLAEDSGAGLWRINLDVEASRGDRRLILRRHPLGGSPAGSAERSILADHVGEFRLAYFGAATPGEDLQWHDRWDGGRVPLLVRVIVGTESGRAEPPIVVRLWTASR